MFTQRRTDELRTILQRRHTLLKVGQNIFITIHSSSMALQDKSKKPVEIIRLMSWAPVSNDRGDERKSVSHSIYLFSSMIQDNPEKAMTPQVLSGVNYQKTKLHSFLQL